MITCTRRLTFSSGHRVYEHESKCANIHGHGYVVLATAEGKLDALGRVIDFSVIKQRLGKWLDDTLDHGMILYEKDPLCETWAKSWGDCYGNKYFLMPSNPTAENIAEFLLNVVCPELFADTGVRITEITVQETENCYATAKR